MQISPSLHAIPPKQITCKQPTILLHGAVLDPPPVPPVPPEALEENDEEREPVEDLEDDDSIWQAAEHPSPFVLFPSSQSSPVSKTPFPHTMLQPGANKQVPFGVLFVSQ